MTDSNRSKLSQSAELLKSFREELFTLWEADVRSSIHNASELSTPILTNTLPALYDHLIDVLTSNDASSVTGSLSATYASEHGNERARLTDYDLGSLISEYQLFRKNVLIVFQSNDIVLNEHQINILTNVIDGTIKESVSSFTLVQAAFREKFVNALIHDLRGPLSTAFLATEIITRVDDIEKIHTLAERAKTQLVRADSMIQELLNSLIFHKGERLQFSPTRFDMAVLLQEIVDEAIFTYGKRFEVEGESVFGWWGEEPIKRAVENLINNAVKYGDSNGIITIKFTTFNGRIFISVHNLGDPIPPDQLENVYKVFYRAKTEQEGFSSGWGIGLSYVRSVAESHGGSIGAESTAIKGTTFLIDIPNDCRPFINVITLE
ncbi:MAG: sensor histidine kinase [Methylotenera sp.]|nr:sensor histidine kinase [Methylotenera sp.]